MTVTARAPGRGKSGDGPGPSPSTRALVLVPAPRRRRRAGERDMPGRIAEAVGLARSIDLDIVDAFAVPVAERRPEPARYL